MNKKVVFLHIYRGGHFFPGHENEKDRGEFDREWLRDGEIPRAEGRPEPMSVARTECCMKVVQNGAAAPPRKWAAAPSRAVESREER